MNDAITLFTKIVEVAIPYGFTFALGQMIVDAFMKMAFRGKIEFK